MSLEENFPNYSFEGFLQGGRTPEYPDSMPELGTLDPQVGKLNEVPIFASASIQSLDNRLLPDSESHILRMLTTM
jgi:hypothetical protein